MASRIVRCVLSGSFRRDYAGLERAYRELAVNGCQVLSPHRLNFVDKKAEFVIDETEGGAHIKTLEDHHLLAIHQADFLWIHVADGHVGLSAAMEIGFAQALKKPVFANDKPDDLTLSHYVTVKPSVFAAIESLEVQDD